MATARQLTAPGKGLLASDESTVRCRERCAAAHPPRPAAAAHPPHLLRRNQRRPPPPPAAGHDRQAAGEGRHRQHSREPARVPGAVLHSARHRRRLFGCHHVQGGWLRCMYLQLRLHASRHTQQLSHSNCSSQVPSPAIHTGNAGAGSVRWHAVCAGAGAAGGTGRHQSRRGEGRNRLPVAVPNCPGSTQLE